MRVLGGAVVDAEADAAAIALTGRSFDPEFVPLMANLATLSPDGPRTGPGRGLDDIDEGEGLAGQAGGQLLAAHPRAAGDHAVHGAVCICPYSEHGRDVHRLPPRAGKLHIMGRQASLHISPTRENRRVVKKAFLTCIDQFQVYV